MAEEGGKLDYGKLLYDLYPKNENLYYITWGIMGIVVILIIAGLILNIIENLYFLCPTMFFCSLGVIPLLTWMERRNNRIKIFEKGIILTHTIRPRGDPFKELATGYASGKRAVKYKDIIAIYPTQPSGRDSRIFKVGLQIILPKEDKKHIVGYIGLGGKRRKKLPKIIHFLKHQMKDDWERKFKKEEPIFF